MLLQRERRDAGIGRIGKLRCDFFVEGDARSGRTRTAASTPRSAPSRVWQCRDPEAVFLATRVAVTLARPGTIKAIVDTSLDKSDPHVFKSDR